MYPDGELVPAAQQSQPLGTRFTERLGAALECFLCSGFPTQVLLILILLLIPMEEKKLREAYGQQYAAYQHQVGKIIPFLH